MPISINDVLGEPTTSKLAPKKAEVPSRGISPEDVFAENKTSFWKTGGQVGAATLAEPAAAAIRLAGDTVGMLPKFAGDFIRMTPPRNAFSQLARSALSDEEIERMKKEAAARPLPDTQFKGADGKWHRMTREKQMAAIESYRATPERLAEAEKVRQMEYPFLPLTKPTGETLSAVGQFPMDVAESMAQKIPGQLPAEIMRYEGINPLKWEHPFLKSYGYGLRAVPGIVFAGGTYKRLVKAGMAQALAGFAASSTLAPQIANQFYDEALAAGLPPEEAMKGALTNAVFATLTEGWALPGIIEGKGHLLTRVIKGAIQEGLWEEGIQSIFENALKVAGWKDETMPTIERIFAGVPESMFAGGMSGGLLGGISSYQDSVEVHRKEQAVAELTKDKIRANAKEAGVPDAIIEESLSKIEREGRLIQLVRDLMDSDSNLHQKIKDGVEKRVADITDLTSDYLVTNVEDNKGDTHEEKTNLNMEVDPADRQKATVILENILLKLQEDRKTNIKLPPDYQKNLRILIQNKLLGQESQDQIIESVLAYYNNPPADKKVIFLSYPAHDITDPGNSVFDAYALQKINLHDFAILNFGKGLTPKDIVIRQEMTKGQKPGFAAAVREILRAEYNKGKAGGLWGQEPPVAPVEVPPEAPIKGISPEEVLAEKAKTTSEEVISELKGQTAEDTLLKEEKTKLPEVKMETPAELAKSRRETKRLTEAWEKNEADAREAKNTMANYEVYHAKRDKIINEVIRLRNSGVYIQNSQLNKMADAEVLTQREAPAPDTDVQLAELGRDIGGDTSDAKLELKLIKEDVLSGKSGPDVAARHQARGGKDAKGNLKVFKQTRWGNPGGVLDWIDALRSGETTLDYEEWHRNRGFAEDTLLKEEMELRKRELQERQAAVKAAQPVANELVNERESAKRGRRREGFIKDRLSKLRDAKDVKKKLKIAHQLISQQLTDAERSEVDAVIQEAREQGYTITRMEGTPYNENNANSEAQIFEKEDRLPEGAKFITEVLEPAIYKDGKLVSPATVVVSLGTGKAAKKAAPEPKAAPAEAVDSGRKPMYYKMPASQNLTGKDTTTLELAEQGLRTSTTRSRALGKVGDVVTFEKSPIQYRITGTHKITAEDMKSPEFIAGLSQTEQWTEEAIRTRHKFQIKPGAVVTYYERMTAAPVQAPEPPEQSGADMANMVALKEAGVPAGTIDNPIVGDIWDKHAQGDFVVIGTNQGGVHGRGLAKQAVDKGLITNGKNGSFADSPALVGDSKVLTIAVKKHWSDKTTGKNLDLMNLEIDKLVGFANANTIINIWVPYLGMGFGEGTKAEIYPILSKLSGLPNVRFIAKDASVVEKYKQSFKPGTRKDRSPVAPSDETPSVAVSADGVAVNTESQEASQMAAPPDAEILKMRSDADTFAYTPGQARALISVADGIDQTAAGGKGIEVIRGYAGTGKTTIIENIINYAKSRGLTVHVMSPTNKAVSVVRNKLRAAGVAGYQSSTVHAGVYEYDPATKRGVFKGLPAQVIVVDEASMVSEQMLSDFVSSLTGEVGQKAYVVFVGDDFQLPPVKEKDSLALKVTPVHGSTQLTEVKRQGADSGILTVANAMRHTKSIMLPAQDMSGVSVRDGDQVISMWENAVRSGLDAVLITPYRTGQAISQVSMNERIRKVLGRVNAVEVGDKLMAINNTPVLSNGEPFNVLAATHVADETLNINLGKGDPNFIKFSIYDITTELAGVPRRTRIALAKTLPTPSIYGAKGLPRGTVIATYGYAITGHKSQGSQWDNVYIIGNPTWMKGTQRARYVYTALTRGAKNVFISATVGKVVPVARIEQAFKDSQPKAFTGGISPEAVIQAKAEEVAPPGDAPEAVKTDFLIVGGRKVARQEGPPSAISGLPKMTVDSEIDSPPAPTSALPPLIRVGVEALQQEVDVDNASTDINDSDIIAMRDMAEALVEKFGRPPTVEELAEALGWSVTMLKEIRSSSSEEYQNDVWSNANTPEEVLRLHKEAADLGLNGENFSFVARGNILDVLRNWYEMLNNPTVQSISEAAVDWYEKRMADKRVKKEATRKKYRAQFDKLMKSAEDLAAKNKSAVPVINEFFFEELVGELNKLPAEYLDGILESLRFFVSGDTITVKDLDGEVLYTLEKTNPAKTSELNELILSLDEKQIEEAKSLTPWAMTEAEKKGGITFTVKYESLLLPTDKGEIALDVGEHNLVREGEDLKYYVEDEAYVVNPKFVSDMVNNENISMEYMEFHAGIPLPGLDVAIQDLLSPISKRLNHNRVDKNKGVRRRQPARLILEMLRWTRGTPFDFSEHAPRLIEFFSGVKGKQKALERRPVFGPAMEDAKSILYKDKVFMEAVHQISTWVGRDAYKGFSDIVDGRLEKLAGQRGKPFKQSEAQHFKDVLLEVVCSAAEQVHANEQFPVTGQYAFTENSNSLHINNDGVVSVQTHKAYYDQIMKMRQALGLPIDPVAQARWADPKGHREPVFWDMLAEFMGGDDSLQRWLLYTKATIEIPILKEELARGVYANTNIAAKIRRGYARRVFDLSYTQKPQGVFARYRKQSSVGTTRKPQQTHQTFEEFIQAGEQSGWIPVPDYMVSLVDYMAEGLATVHQSDTLALLHTVHAPFNHHNPEFVAATPQNYLPKGWSKNPLTVVQYEHSPLIMREAARLTKKLGKEVKVNAVLESLGFLQGKQMEGLTVWWRGAFQNPYIYRSVSDLFNAMFDTRSGGGLSQIPIDVYRLVKHVKTVNPVDSIGVWVGLPYMRNHPMKFVTLLPRALWHSVRGFGMGMRALLTGKQDKPSLEANKTPNLHLALMTGFQATSYANALVAMNDWIEQKGLFPERYNKLGRMKDFFITIGGINSALFNHIVAKDGMTAWDNVFAENKAKGMSDYDAASRASAYMNNATFLLNRSIWNREGRWFNLLEFSRGLAVGAVRNFMLLTYRTPLIGPTLKKAGLFNYHTSNVGKLTNSLLNAEMTTLDMDVVSAQLFADTAKLLMLAMISKGIMQYLLSFRDDDELDEHGEIGSKLGERAKKRNILENEANGFGKVRMGMKEQGRQLYADYQLFRWQKDIFTAMLGTFNRDYGTGGDRWLQNKLGMFVTTWIKVLKNDDGEGNPVFNPYEESKLVKALDIAKFAFWEELVPLGWEPTLLAEDQKRDELLRWFNRLGGSISRGESVQTTDWENVRQQRETIRKEQFEEKLSPARKGIRRTRASELFKLIDRQEGVTPEVIRRERLRRFFGEHHMRKEGKTYLKRSMMRKRREEEEE